MKVSQLILEKMMIIGPNVENMAQAGRERLAIEGALRQAESGEAGTPSRQNSSAGGEILLLALVIALILFILAPFVVSGHANHKKNPCRGYTGPIPAVATLEGKCVYVVNPRSLV